MKKVIVTVVMLSGVIGFAQNRDHKEMDDLSAEQIAVLQTKKMTLALDLTEDQQQDMQLMHYENATARKEKMEARKSSGEVENQKKPTAEERFTIQLERLDHAIAHKAKMKEILSPDQFKKWEKIQARRGHHKRDLSRGKQRARDKRN